MPLLRFDLVEGRSESEIRKILDATHEVLLETLKVPKHDRYQVVHEHKRSRMIVEDTGLGLVRSDHVLLLQVTSRKRKKKQKEAGPDPTSVPSCSDVSRPSPSGGR